MNRSALSGPCLEDDDYLIQFERTLDHAAAMNRQLARYILDEALRHPERLAYLPVAMRERKFGNWCKKPMTRIRTDINGMHVDKGFRVGK